VRVVVADDAMLTRRGIVDVLRAGGLDVVGEAGDGDGLLALVGTTRPDAVVVDIRMPPTHTDEGLVATERIRAAHPGTAVLILSGYVEATYLLRLIEHRPESVGYLLKDRVLDPDVLLDALRRVTAGQTVVDPTLVSELLGRLRRQDPIDTLSAREREVLGLVAEGLSNRAIAERIVVTERTVEAHVARIFDRLGLLQDAAQNRRVLAVLTYLRA
jgi:DNA-binding NarL/FixJ family response regulator